MASWAWCTGSRNVRPDTVGCALGGTTDGIVGAVWTGMVGCPRGWRSPGGIGA